MTVNLIKNKKDYKKALNRLEEIFDSKKGTAEGDELEILSLLIENYENKRFSIEAPNPIDAIRFRMEQLGYNQSDLVGIVGSKSKVSEVLNKKRKLSIKMIRRLNNKLSIPAEVLIKPY